VNSPTLTHASMKLSSAELLKPPQGVSLSLQVPRSNNTTEAFRLGQAAAPESVARMRFLVVNTLLQR